MVRLFHVYYPVRTIVLLICEALIVSGSFLCATVLLLGSDSILVLAYENGALKILGVTLGTLLCSYYFDLYEPRRLPSRSEIYFRMLLVLGLLSFILGFVIWMFPNFSIGSNVLVVGLTILTVNMLGWRSAYEWLIGRAMFRERVYVLGSGDKAQRVVDEIRSRSDLGMEIVGWAGALGGTTLSREDMSVAVQNILSSRSQVDRVIVAIQDRRGTMPVKELLDLRLRGRVKVEDASMVLERVSGKIEVDDLQPSAVIFSDGFRLNYSVLFARRVVSCIMAGIGLLLCSPLLPIVALLIKLDSPGPILFSQERVGLDGQRFFIHKFRSMRADAEKGTGAVWAGKNDPRITRFGNFLRRTRLDEIPQLWNVLKGDMNFVGPRPERPEFVSWLSEAIPYYNLRHIIRPGVTGWAQVRYQYGSTLEETKEKLRYDLYYAKHLSVSLDLLVMFETIKIILLRRGSQ